MIPVTTKDYRTLKAVLSGQSVMPLRQLLLNTPLHTGGKVIQLKPQQVIAATALKLFGFSIAAAKISTPSGRNHFTPQDNALVEDALARLMEIAGLCNDIIGRGETINNTTAEYSATLAEEAGSSMVALSKILHGREVLIVYNSDACEPKERFISTSKAHTLRPLYGYDSTGYIHAHTAKAGSRHYIKVYLKPLQLIVLQSID